MNNKKITYALKFKSAINNLLIFLLYHSFFYSFTWLVFITFGSVLTGILFTENKIVLFNNEYLTMFIPIFIYLILLIRWFRYQK